MTVKFLLKLIQLLRIRNHSVITTIDGQTMRLTRELPTSSFFHALFWNDQHDNSPQATRWIVEHEKIHARQWHSLDLMVIEIIGIVQWFNPFVRWMGKELRMLHEFIADRKIVERCDVKEYMQLFVAPVSGERVKLPVISFSDFILERIQRLYKAPDSFYAGSTYL